MIKFFRKIRQNMIKENKASKYLLYAIGEIILVVIGILIALSINNWNDELKKADKKDIIIANLISDLEKDVNAFKKAEIRNQKSIDFIDNFIKTMKIDNSLDFINIIDERYAFYPNSSKYKSIVSTNEIELLDDSTIDKLTDYYEYDYYRLKRWISDLDYHSIEIEKFITNVLPKHPIKNDTIFNKEVIKLLNKKEVYNLLSYSKDGRTGLNALVISTRKKAEKLLIDIEK